MSDKDHNDMVNLLGPKKAKKVKKGVDKTKTYFISKDRWVLVSSAVILFFSFLLVTLSGYVSSTRQDDIKQAMYTYEQQIFQKKIQIYREEYRVKGVQVEELNNRIELLEKELKDAYNQVSFANMQLEKASRMINAENTRIKLLDKSNKQLTTQLTKKNFVVEELKEDLKQERTDNSDFKKANSDIQEEERLLNKEMRAKNARIGHLEKDIQVLKDKLKTAGENYKTLKLTCAELEIKEKLESEEIELLKASMDADVTDNSDLSEDLQKEINELTGDGSEDDSTSGEDGDEDTSFENTDSWN